MTANALNVLGTDLVSCSYDPLTGYYRDGCCNTGPMDRGTVAAQLLAVPAGFAFLGLTFFVIRAASF